MRAPRSDVLRILLLPEHAQSTNRTMATIGHCAFEERCETDFAGSRSSHILSTLVPSPNWLLTKRLARPHRGERRVGVKLFSGLLTFFLFFG